MADSPPGADLSPAGPPFLMRTDESPEGAQTVTVSGEIDLLTAPEVGAAVTAAQDCSDAVLLDLREVAFLGSAGLSVLVDAARRAQDTNGRFAVVVGAHPVQRAIEVTGLDAVLSVFDDVDQAVRYVTG